MKKVLTLSLFATATLFANESINLETISVVEKNNSVVVTDVSNEQIKSADLAEALNKNIPSISIVRRSGIANDIILRGQKKDNINILIDDAKIYGACPNRMDPATSHILSNNIESVKVIQGPYDVENFGTLSGKVSVKTKEPTKDFGGELNVGFGSFGYKKASATISGGTDKLKVLVSASNETSNSYEDGKGNDFLEQQIENGVPVANQYSNNDLDAYEKSTVLTKAIYNITDDSEIKLSYNANRSNNILYPNTPMDADYDDSDIYTLGYTSRNNGSFSKELNLDYYYSKVDHPMSTRLRNAGSSVYMTNHMKSSIWGTKLKNSFELADSLITIGLDTSVRNWEGRMYNSTSTMNSVSLASTDTKNKAIFSKLEKSFGAIDLEVGARYDYTNIDTVDSSLKDRKYSDLSANIFAVYNASDSTKYFAGIGKASRVPDARELYYSGLGNEDLEDTKNYEVDLGFEKTMGDLSIKTKLFYSKLKDYIYSVNGTGFENIDASIYGAEISGMYLASENFFIDYGIAYQKGKKDEALSGQSDKDLAEIPPLKANLAFNYEQDSTTYTAEVIAVDSWDTIDSDNGEQELAGYGLVNLKANTDLTKNIGFTFGVDNVFDKTYNSTNTYNDIRYIGVGDTELINDPGRYIYANLKYSF